MKTLKYVLGSVAVVALLAACHNYEPLDDTGYIDENSLQEWVGDAQVVTIHEFLEKCLKEKTDEKYTPVRPNSGSKNLYSVNDITANLVIVGRVVSTDVPGNIYKAIYIQDVNKPEQGLKIGVDAGSIGGTLPQGQVIAIKVKGLAVGKYANMPQLGVPYYNSGKEGNPNEKGKVGWEIGRIPLSALKKNIVLVGQPDCSKIKANEVTIAEIQAATPDFDKVDYMAVAKMCAKYVVISDVELLTKEGKDYKTHCYTDIPTMDDYIFAPSTDGIGYPQSRAFTNGVDTMCIGTSEYAKFAQAPLPGFIRNANGGIEAVGKTYRGKIYGFIGYYNDKERNTVDGDEWSITLNGLEGVGIMKERDGLQLTDSLGNLWRAEDVYYPAF